MGNTSKQSCLVAGKCRSYTRWGQNSLSWSFHLHQNCVKAYNISTTLARMMPNIGDSRFTRRLLMVRVTLYIVVRTSFENCIIYHMQCAKNEWGLQEHLLKSILWLQNRVRWCGLRDRGLMLFDIGTFWCHSKNGRDHSHIDPSIKVLEAESARVCKLLFLMEQIGKDLSSKNLIVEMLACQENQNVVDYMTVEEGRISQFKCNRWMVELPSN